MKKSIALMLGISFLILGISGCVSGKGQVDSTSKAIQKEKRKLEKQDKDDELQTQTSSTTDEEEIKEEVECVAPNGEKFQYGLLKGWREYPEFESINPVASFVITNYKTFMGAIIDSKEDIVDFAAFENMMVEQMALRAGEEILTTPIELNGMKGSVASFEAEIEGANIHYVVYYLESKDNYIQLLTWVSKSMFKDNEEQMKQIAMTFKPID